MMLPDDKQKHVAAGYIIGVVAMVLAAKFSVPFPWLVGLAIVVLAGFGKEVLDYVENKAAQAKGLPDTHDVDTLDFAATLAGGFVAVTPLIILGI